MVRYSLGYPPLFPLQCPRQPSRQRIVAVSGWFVVGSFLFWFLPLTLTLLLAHSLTRSLLANISLISAPLSMFRTLRSVTRIRAPSSKLFCTSRPEPQVRMPTFHILFLLSHTHTYDMPIIRELSRSRSYTHKIYSHTHSLALSLTRMSIIRILRWQRAYCRSAPAVSSTTTTTCTASYVATSTKKRSLLLKKNGKRMVMSPERYGSRRVRVVC